MRAHSAIDGMRAVFHQVGMFSLMNAYHVIAKEHGFNNWNTLIAPPDTELAWRSPKGREPSNAMANWMKFLGPLLAGHRLLSTPSWASESGTPEVRRGLGTRARRRAR